MARRLLSPALFFALGTGLTAAGAAADHGHLGQVVEYATGRPLVASVKAWAQSSRTGRDGDCSLYGDSPLDSRQSDGDGRFLLSIGSDNRTYTVTYCAAGYVPRDDRDLPNDADSSVLPTPAALWPVTMSPDEEALFESAVQRRLVLTLNELAYLRKANETAYDRAASRLAEIGKTNPAAVRALAALAADWGK
jgi:hypothetical protein